MGQAGVPQVQGRGLRLRRAGNQKIKSTLFRTGNDMRRKFLVAVDLEANRTRNVAHHRAHCILAEVIFQIVASFTYRDVRPSLCRGCYPKSAVTNLRRFVIS